VIDNLGDSGKLVLGYARQAAAKLGSDAVGSEHLFLGVGDLEDLAIRRALLEASVDLDEACIEVRKEAAGEPAAAVGDLPLAPEADAALGRAQDLASRLGGREVEAPHILAALLGDDHGVAARVVRGLGADPGAAVRAVTAMIESGEQTPSEFYKTRRNVEQAGLGKTAELLESLGRDLTEDAENGRLSPIIGRDREIQQLVTILLGMSKNNALLVGEAGVGKTAVVEGLAQRIVAHEAPGLDGMRIRTIEVGSLVAGTIYRGQFEQRLKDLIDGVRDRDDVILFIDEMHMLVGAGETGAGGSVDAANMLKPVLARGEVKVIGATTLDEYRQYLEPDTALMRRFQQVVVGEPSREDTLAILRGLRRRYEDFHLVTIDDTALEAAVDLSVRYLHDRYLPDKALALVDRACTEEKLEAGIAQKEQGKGRAADGGAVVDGADIAEVVSVQLEIPIARLAGDEKRRLTGMAAALKERVVGQDHAVDAISQAVIRARTGLGNPDRPYGVFLFLGPTGVGKTKLAEETATFLFGDLDDLIELDMSQYVHPYSVSELIGAERGIHGWQEGGRLTNAVRARPYSVVLLDEMEKAHPAVWNVFLQVFDNGRLRDALDRVIDFRNTIIVMTSNVGARRFADRTPIGFTAPTPDGEVSFADIEDEVREDLEDVFTPEFLNRVDDIIVFHALSRESIRRIVRRRIEEVVLLDLELDDDALEFLADRSYDPAMGARPVRRTVQRLVANPLSLMLANDELAEGDAVRVGVADGHLAFDRVAPDRAGAGRAGRGAR
jgi:ATP-dependent Clp protease ATP-binding subunit ClpC